MIKVYFEKNKYGTICWYKEGTKIPHREDGPAKEYSNRSKEWYYDGELHRADGPAIDYIDGYKEYWLNGLCHRKDGPAIILNGSGYYYLNDKYYPNITTDEEWLIFQIIN